MGFQKTSLLLVFFVAVTAVARSLPGVAAPSKLEPASIKAVYKNSTSEYKFMFPNVPADELDDNNSKFPLTIPKMKEKYFIPKRKKLSVSNINSIAELFSEIKIRYEEQEAFRRLADKILRKESTENSLLQKFASEKRKYSVPTMEDFPSQSLTTRTSGDSISLSGSTGDETEEQTPIVLSPEEMEEINETGRLCSEDGECIYFSDDWGNNCCPFG